MKQRVISLSPVTVSLHHLPKMSEAHAEHAVTCGKKLTIVNWS